MSLQDSDSGAAPGSAPIPAAPAPSEPTGISAAHPARAAATLRVAPTAERAVNTVSLDLVPVACVQLPDILFEFDSSFPGPDVAAMLNQLPGVRDQHRNAKGQLPPLALFGHADPTGTDDYNKQLSGRRAMAIYGALTRDHALWDFLFDHPQGGDDWTAKKVITVMRAAVADSNDLSRATLIDEYFKVLSTEAVAKDQFIAQGRDSQGKGDYQGCGEFNPLRVLSTSENKSLSKIALHQDNAPNRRVILFMFRPGTKIDPAKWPCPRAGEAGAGCTKRFFGPPNTGDQRRAAGPQRREFADRLDTFACRFYDRVARLSPCELPIPSVLFEYGLEAGKGFPWSDKAQLTIASTDGSHAKTFVMTEGEKVGTHRVFLFPGPKPGLQYRGRIKDGRVTVDLFDPVELFRIQDPADALNTLPLPQPKIPAELPPLPPGPSFPYDGPVDIDGDMVEFAATVPPGPPPTPP